MLKKILISLFTIILSLTIFSFSDVYAEEGEEDCYTITFYSEEGHITDETDEKTTTEQIVKGQEIGYYMIQRGEIDKNLVGWKSSVDGEMYSPSEVYDMVPESDIRFEAVWKDKNTEVLIFVSKEGYLKGEPSLKRAYEYIKYGSDYNDISLEYMPRGREGYYCLGFKNYVHAQDSNDIEIDHCDGPDGSREGNQVYYAVWTEGVDGSESCEIKLSKDKFPYDMKTHYPKVKVYYKGKKLSTKNYTVIKPIVSKEVAYYEITVKFKNGFYGKSSKKYSICNQVKDYKLVGRKKSFGFNINKIYDGSPMVYGIHDNIGVIVQYSTDKKFSEGKTKTVKMSPKKFYKLINWKNKKGIVDITKRGPNNVGTVVSRYVLINKLKKKKTYYVRIQLYEKSTDSDDKGAYVYSDWSKVKKVKTK